VVSNNTRIYLTGRHMRKCGAPCPPKPAEDCEPWCEEELLWIGYRVELAMQWLKQKKVAEMCGGPVPEIAE
jgi:hypothetical protein